MRRSLIFVLLLLGASPQTGWREEEVGEGVVWKFRHFDDLYGSRQSVSLLEVDLSSKKIAIRFAASEKSLEKTGAIARRTRAVAAVNGGYFDMKKGGPVGLLKIDGKVIAAKDEPRQGILGVDAEGRVRITPWSDAKEFTHALSAGPVLLVEGQVKIGGGFGHEKPRHPRTAVGLTAKNKLILITVDGRTPEAAGMTLDELARFMKDLGCVSALNLDGGGSTTMWVKGEPDDGVVNFPCDDRKYDHAGSRSVANVLLVLAPDVVMLDNREASLTGEWKASTSAKEFFGEDFAICADKGASIRWTAKLEAGEYEVFARWPSVARASTKAVFKIAGRDCSVDLSKSPGKWFSLGVHKCASDTSVELVSENGGALVADVVKFVER